MGLIGDVHGAIDRLRAALDVLLDSDVDAVLATGDVVDGPVAEDVQACIETLCQHGAWVVRGNHDRWELNGFARTSYPPQGLNARHREFLRWCPSTVDFSTSAGRALLCHAVGEDDMSFFRPHHTEQDLQYLAALHPLRAGPWDFMLCGHTHQRMVRDLGDLWVINAGALTYSDCPGFARVDFEARRVRFWDFQGDTSATPMAGETHELRR
ncbi:MAG TPA: metallophosphoesterase family protein [Myxococcales bacterium LLY-WYZ-16_1]|nr:metallophosphoesterase family protein [Myxococcales bacterium LLY-WYZ-16_1]